MPKDPPLKKEILRLTSFAQNDTTPAPKPLINLFYYKTFIGGKHYVFYT